MIFLFNKDQQRVGIIPQKNIITAYRTENLYGPDTFEAEVKNNADLAGVLYIGHRDTLNTNQYHIYKIVDTTWEGQNIIINGLELAYDELAAYGYIKDQRPNNQSAVTILDAILSGTPWTQQGSTTTKTATTNFYYESRLSALQKLLEVTGCEMRSFVTISGANITGKHITLVDRLGEDRGRRYVHGDKLLSVKREIKFDSIYTALVGRGKGEETEGGGYGRRITFDTITWSKAAGDPVDKPANQEYVEIPEMTAIYGYPGGAPRVGIVEFGDITDPAELLRATYDQLVEITTPKTTYQASVRDDSMTAIGDTVAIIRRDLGIEYKTRIFRREQNIMNPPEVKIELGTPVQNYTATKIQALNKKLNSVEQQVNQTNLKIVQLIKDAIADSYWGEDGYNYDLEVGNEYGLPAGLYSFDKPIDQDPTKFVYLGAGKIVISNEKNPDGSWKLKTLMDGDGLGADTVGADQVIAGSLTADKITMRSGETVESAIETIETTPGESAYELAVKNGFTGTEQEWVASLKGSDGKDGIEFRWNLLKDSYGKITLTGLDFQDYYLVEPIAHGERVTVVLKGSPGADKASLTAYNSGGSVAILRSNGFHEESPGMYIARNIEWITEYVNMYGKTIKASNTFFRIYHSPSDITRSLSIEWVKIVRGTDSTLEWAPSYKDREKELQAMQEEYIAGLHKNEQAIASLADDDTLTPYEKADLASFAEDVKGETSILAAKLGEGTSEILALRAAEKNFLDYIDQAVNQGEYSAIDGPTYQTYFVDWKKAQEAAEIATENLAIARYTEQEAGLISLGSRIGNYEEQIKLGDGKIAINVDTTQGLTPAMELTKDRLSFLTNGEEAAYFANGRMMIENAIIIQKLEMGNHSIEKHGTEFTVFRWIGG